jgi:hypothetical protein
LFVRRSTLPANLDEKALSLARQNFDRKGGLVWRRKKRGNCGPGGAEAEAVAGFSVMVPAGR